MSNLRIWYHIWVVDCDITSHWACYYSCLNNLKIGKKTVLFSTEWRIHQSWNAKDKLIDQSIPSTLKLQISGKHTMYIHLSCNIHVYITTAFTNLSKASSSAPSSIRSSSRFSALSILRFWFLAIISSRLTCCSFFTFFIWAPVYSEIMSNMV